MSRIHKEYEHGFLLEPTKLRRLVDTIHDRLGDHKNTTTHDTFEVFLTGNKREEMISLDEVLALDNSSRHKITRLAILSSASTPGAARPEHEVKVDFACPKPTTTDTTNNTKVVAVSVRSDAAGWAGRTLSEVEEQVERTWLHHARPLVFLIGLLLLVLIILASQFVSFGPGLQHMWLNSSDLDRIEAMLEQPATLTDENLRESPRCNCGIFSTLKGLCGQFKPTKPHALCFWRCLYL